MRRIVKPFLGREGERTITTSAMAQGQEVVYYICHFARTVVKSGGLKVRLALLLTPALAFTRCNLGQAICFSPFIFIKIVK